jgi:hypothetical protein
LKGDSKAKSTGRVTITVDVIAAIVVTLALITVGIAVSMMIPVQTAHASCTTGAKGTFVCSGAGGTSSCSFGSNSCASSGSDGRIIIIGGHNACSSPKGGQSDNPGHPSASSGQGC